MKPMTMHEKLQLLRDRYFLMVAPLVLVLGIAWSRAPALAWTAGILLAALTINKVIRLR